MRNPPYSFRTRPQRSPQPQIVQRPAWVNSPKFRAILVWAVLITSTGLLTINLFYVQVVQGLVLSKIAKSHQMTYLRPFIPRRDIVDRNGNVLALDRPVYTLYAHPRLFKISKPEMAEKLAPILNRPAADLVKQFDQQETGIRVEYSLVEDIANRITAMGLDGLELIQHQQRLYPYKDMAADIVGFVNAEHKGQAGLELSQENVLERTADPIELKQMGDGSLMPDGIPAGFLNQDDLQLKLTIDTRLQHAIQPVLQRQVKKVGAKRGTVIVMDAHSGELLALASDPTYDPNEYYKFQPERFKTWPISDLYEPGSTFKPINVAIALETKTVTPKTQIDNPSAITVDDWPIQGGSGGSDTVTDVVINSYNVGMVHIMDKLDPEMRYSWLKRLGLGGTSGIDLPSEEPGQFKARKTFLESHIERAVTAFGQGFSLTPIQLVQLHGSLANGGKLVTPHIIQGLYNSKGQLFWKPNLRAPRQIFSPETTKAILPMMEGVVREGTGKAAQIPGYRIAGKTGTSQKATSTGGYAKDLYVTSFVGIVPAEQPRYVILAVIDEPAGGGYGGTVAAPVVHEVIKTLVNMENIPPSSKVEPEEAESANEEP